MQAENINYTIQLNNRECAASTCVDAAFVAPKQLKILILHIF